MVFEPRTFRHEAVRYKSRRVNHHSSEFSSFKTTIHISSRSPLLLRHRLHESVGRIFTSTRRISAQLQCSGEHHSAAPLGYLLVGGYFSSVAIPQMKAFGRIAVCGGISLYNDTTPQTGPYPHLHMIFKQLKMEGFLVTRWEHKNEESLRRMLTWMQEGKLKCREHVTDGFENMPAAFMGMLKGQNVGKAIVKV